MRMESAMRGQTNTSILRKKLQRTLRNNMKLAERRLWSHLRRRQINGCKFRRQHPFKNHILDFVCIEQMLVIEVDGGHHLQNATAVRLRTHDLEKAGFRVLRFWNNEILRDIDGVFALIEQALRLQPRTVRTRAGAKSDCAVLTPSFSHPAAISNPQMD